MPRIKKQTKRRGPSLAQKGIKSPFPQVIEPMLATKISEPFNDPNWLYEIKWDGYRIVSHVQRGKAVLHSRSLQNYTSWYPPVAEELTSFKDDLVLDGEIVVLSNEGLPNFDALQKYREGDTIAYYVFDLLWYNGKNLLGIPLEERKTILESILSKNTVIKYSAHFDDGLALFEQVESLGLEGIVCKKRNSLYEPGVRTKNWLKLPTAKRQEFVIGGWTESASGRLFRSLLFGAYENGKLISVGHSGSGFKNADMKMIMARLKKLEIKKRPFADEVETETKPHWVKPQLVGEFKYATTTRSGKIRKPAIFLGFRADKNPREVVLERTFKTGEVIEEKKPAIVTSKDSNWPKIEGQPITSREEFEIEGCKVELTNVEKELWKGITKADLLQYYNSIANYILPYIQKRPQSLHVKYRGLTVPGEYIKDMEGREPECAELFSVERKHKKAGKNPVIDYLVCNNRATLLWMINLGCIDVNPWTSRTSNYLHPDFIVIDLDPSDKDFKKAIETARAAKQFFDETGVTAFAKTSGKTGIHLFTPCAGFTFPDARTIAEKICNEIHLLVPRITTTEISLSRRGDKLYVDPNQNDEADTVAAPYSARPFHIPTVSTPIAWKEVNEKLNPTDFTIKTIAKRLEKRGDLWKDILNPWLVRSNSKTLLEWL
jgi:bifunctional non-homologous end joining protein LigD